MVTPTAAAYLAAAASAAALLADPAVAAAWDQPSALAEFTVRGLAGHLARQITNVPRVLALGPATDPPVSLLEHYGRVLWVRAGPQDDVNVSIRRDGEAEAHDGAAALAARVAGTVTQLAALLAAEPADRVVLLPWTGWPLSLDDLLITRMLEIAVHCDDLAASVAVPAPALPPQVIDPVLGLLTQLAVRRHGQSAVLRALSRAERAPATISAI
jgi:Mycothiol maleylpyruvate isomerase N-terminal domain